MQPSGRRGRPAVHGSRDEILAAAVRIVAEEGLDDLSKSRLAEKLGCSTFVLTYHFGSREELLAAIVEHTEERHRELLTEMASKKQATVADLIQSYWNDLPVHDDPNYARLWLEVALRASREPDKYPTVGQHVMKDWIKLVDEHFMGDDRDETRATLIVAALMGLELLNLLDNTIPAKAVLANLAEMVSRTDGPSR